MYQTLKIQKETEICITRFRTIQR
uniref:Uncharacterized protein n=1 Tax=Arundo donax TaxID=35708 RepID=A0A0A9FN39_ARUDO